MRTKQRTIDEMASSNADLRGKIKELERQARKRSAADLKAADENYEDGQSPTQA